MGQMGKRKEKEALMGCFSESEGLLRFNLCSRKGAKSRKGH